MLKEKNKEALELSFAFREHLVPIALIVAAN